MKQNIIILTLGLCIGMLIMINQVCKQKDNMIRLLMKNNSSQVENIVSIPKNLPIVNLFLHFITWLEIKLWG